MLTRAQTDRLARAYFRMQDMNQPTEIGTEEWELIMKLVYNEVSRHRTWYAQQARRHG